VIGLVMATLSDVLTPRAVGDRYQLDVAPGWLQGRGVFGGLVVGALVRAIEQRTADPARRVRSVTAELPGPVEGGTADIIVEALRHGKNVSTVRAALSQHGEVRSHAVVILAASRGGAQPAAWPIARPIAWPISWNDLTPPTLPAWRDIAPSTAGVSPGQWPEFARHFEYRVVEGLPASGGAARSLGWVRSREPGTPQDAAYVAAMIDAWWPAGVVPLSAMRPTATIAFTLDIVAGAADLDPEVPLIYRATAPVCADGYFLETRELWSEDGRLIAINHQTFAIIQ
jgi:acyl-CoA thioesterase